MSVIHGVEVVVPNNMKGNCLRYIDRKLAYRNGRVSHRHGHCPGSYDVQIPPLRRRQTPQDFVVKALRFILRLRIFLKR